MTPTLTTTPPTVQATDLPNVIERTVALSVERSRLGTHRKVRHADATVVPTAQPEDDADRDALDQRMLSVAKKLWNAPELRAIEQLDREAQEWLFTKCVQSYFRPGIYLVPLTSFQRVEAYMLGYQARREALVEAFVQRYDARVAEMRAHLGALFSERDYPTRAAAAAAFTLRWSYLDLGTPRRLRSLDARLYRAAQERAEAQVQEMAGEIRQALRVAMADLVAHMQERLTGEGVGGKRKVFRDTMVSRLRDFLDDFADRNVTDDDRLATLVHRARGLLDGVDPDALREDGAVRDRVAAGMATIKAELDAMVTTAARAISFED